MSNYVHIETGAYPIHQGDIRLEYPEIGIDFVCPAEYALVEETTPPPFDELTQRLSVDAQRDGDHWFMVWTVEQKSLQEIEDLRFAIESRNNPQSRNTNLPGGVPDVIQ